MGRKKDKKWPKDPDMIVKKAEEMFREALKDVEWEKVTPKLKWKVQHRLQRMLKNIMFEIWQQNHISVIMKPDGSMEVRIEFPAWMTKLGEENGKTGLG